MYEKNENGPKTFSRILFTFSLEKTFLAVVEKKNFFSLKHILLFFFSFCLFLFFLLLPAPLAVSFLDFRVVPSSSWPVSGSCFWTCQKSLRISQTLGQKKIRECEKRGGKESGRGKEKGGVKKKNGKMRGEMNEMEKEREGGKEKVFWEQKSYVFLPLPWHI